MRRHTAQHGSDYTLYAAGYIALITEIRRYPTIETTQQQGQSPMPQSRDSKRNMRLTRTTHAQLDDAQQHTHQVKDDQLTVNTPNT